MPLVHLNKSSRLNCWSLNENKNWHLLSQLKDLQEPVLVTRCSIKDGCFYSKSLLDCHVTAAHVLFCRTGHFGKHCLSLYSEQGKMIGKSLELSFVPVALKANKPLVGIVKKPKSSFLCILFYNTPLVFCTRNRYLLNHE